jgi:ATP-dependent RNA helicase DDX3X
MPDDPTAIEWHDGTDDESDDGLGGGFGGDAGGFDADATGFGGEAAADTSFGGGEAGGFGGDDAGFSAGADEKVASW